MTKSDKIIFGSFLGCFFLVMEAPMNAVEENDFSRIKKNCKFTFLLILLNNG